LARAMKISCSLTVILLSPLLVNAYTWQFTSPPRQCKNVTLSIQDSGGQPPYSLLIIPTGPSPLPNTEVRTVLNIPFSGTRTTLSFNLNYPENSSFVAVVRSYLSRHIFSAIFLIPPHTDCRSATRMVLVPGAPALRSPFSNRPTRVVTVPLSPPKSLGFSTSSLQVGSLNVNQYGCGGMRLSSMGASRRQSFLIWCGLTVFIHPSRHVPPCRTVNFYGAIPGGTSFAIPQGSLSSNNVTGTGFNWTADIAGGTDVLLVGNDNGGIASGGYVKYTIANSVNNSCLNNNSPSSTAGSPAGGSYPTGTGEPSSNGSGSHSSS
jgi:hypothetical protein